MAISIFNSTDHQVTVHYPNGLYHLKAKESMTTDYKGKFSFTRLDMATCGYKLYNGKFKITGTGIEAVKVKKVFDWWQGGIPALWLIKK
jgi:hypothetical protein